MNENNPDRPVEFCEWFLHMRDERESSPYFIVWSDEATFKINGTVT
jgi:hypothetical protein